MKPMKICGYVLALCMALPLALTAFAADGASFSDVDAGASYARAVRWAADNGYVNGYSDGRFGVDEVVTRAQLSAIFHRAAGSPAASGELRFSDVAATAYYRSAAGWAADGGLINGYADGRFGVNDPVTRQQLAAILWCWAGSPAASGEDYADEADIAAYARTAVDWSRSNGILSGRADGRFAPADGATRAEVVSALYQYRRLPGGSELPEVPGSSDVSDSSRILVAYFSATNQTGNLANRLAGILHADLYEIIPAQPYTSADLNYTDSGCRANREQNDPAARPAIAGSAENLADYDTVFLGYPIWHGQAPRIICTFLESGDFAGKSIVPFCTSGSSGIGSSADHLQVLTPDAHWLEGRRFSGGASQGTVEEWVNSLKLAESGAAAEEETLEIQVNGTTIAARLAKNSSAQALAELLAEGPRTIEMRDYGGMEKVGPLGQTLPTNNERITTQAGDLALYQGNQLVIYYAANTWSLTRLGKIQGVTAQELRDILGGGMSALHCPCAEEPGRGGLLPAPRFL